MSLHFSDSKATKKFSSEVSVNSASASDHKRFSHYKSKSLVIPGKQAMPKVSFSPAISINVSSPDDKGCPVAMIRQSGTPSLVPTKIYKVVLIGESVLDRRFTSHMLPWIIVEIMRKKSMSLELTIQLTETSLKATVPQDDEVIFTHKLKNICKFSKTHQDRSCFMYLTRETVEAPYRCYVYQTESEEMVCSIFLQLFKMLFAIFCFALPVSLLFL